MTQTRSMNNLENVSLPLSAAKQNEDFSYLETSFVKISPGAFEMGCPSDDKDADKMEKPLHQEKVSEDYWMAKYLVTQEDYQKIMDSNPSRFEGERNPVEMVTWDNAISFCEKLTIQSHKNKTLPKTHKYCLPTEVQWEFAGRGGCKSQHFLYAGSNDPDKVSWHATNSDGITHPVGELAPNELGLYDMAGNVYEWCLDYFDHYGNKQNQTNALSEHSCRGGCWGSIHNYLRITYRKGLVPDGTYGSLGFRLVVVRH